MFKNFKHIFIALMISLRFKLPLTTSGQDYPNINMHLLSMYLQLHIIKTNFSPVLLKNIGDKGDGNIFPFKEYIT